MSDTGEIVIRFVEVRILPQTGGEWGEVHNPEIDFNNWDEFGARATRLIDRCNREGHQLQVLAVVFRPNGPAIKPYDHEKKYTNYHDLRETIKRILTRLAEGESQEYSGMREHLAKIGL